MLTATHVCLCMVPSAPKHHLFDTQTCHYLKKRVPICFYFNNILGAEFNLGAELKFSLVSWLHSLHGY